MTLFAQKIQNPLFKQILYVLRRRSETRPKKVSKKGLLALFDLLARARILVIFQEKITKNHQKSAIFWVRMANRNTRAAVLFNGIFLAFGCLGPSSTYRYSCTMAFYSLFGCPGGQEKVEENPIVDNFG